MMDAEEVVAEWVAERMSSEQLLKHIFTLFPADAIALLKLAKKADEEKFMRELGSKVSDDIVNECTERYALYLFDRNKSSESIPINPKFIRYAKLRGTYPPADGRWPVDCRSREAVEAAEKAMNEFSPAFSQKAVEVDK